MNATTSNENESENVPDAATVRDAVSIADRCLHQITECVDAVRTRFDHSHTGHTVVLNPPTALRDTIGIESGSDSTRGEEQPAVPSIPMRSHKDRISISSDLYQEARSKLRRRCRFRSPEHRESSPPNDDDDNDDSCHWSFGSDSDDAWLVPAPPTGNDTSERIQLLYEVFLPLLATLGMCYEIIDGLPASEPASIATDSTSTSKAINDIGTTGLAQRRKNHRRPTPPVGMLSIQNYTNVACLVELMMCWSVVPALPPNVLVSLDERVRYQLPKSIRGRLSPRSLAPWDTSSPQPNLNRKDTTTTTTTTTGTVAEELQLMVTVVGRLLLLDRFRPMLLPRHLPDLMAAILYRKEFLRQTSRGRESGIMARLEKELVGDSDCDYDCDWSSETRALDKRDASGNNRLLLPPPPSSPPTRVDVSWRVKSYQTLLRNGRATPGWLRAAVSTLLCHVAATDFSVLVAVFVHPAVVGDNGGMDPTAAVARLARAIVPPLSGEPTTSDHGHHTYLTGVCHQLVAVLDGARPDANLGLQTHRSGDSEGWQQAQQTMSIQTVWAVIDLLPTSILESILYPAILRVNDVVHVDSLAAQGRERVDFSCFHKVIHRLATLLWGRPTMAASAYTISKVCRLFLKPWSPWLCGVDTAQRNDETSMCQLTLLGAMIRLASRPSVIESKIKEDAILTVRLFAVATMETSFHQSDEDASRVSGVDVLAVALLHAIAPNQWDVNGWSLETSSDQDCRDNSVEKLWLVRGRTTNDLPVDIASVSARGKFICKSLFVGGTNSTDQKTTTAREGSTQLSSLVFQILLVTYFGLSKSLHSEVSHCSFTFLADSHFRVVPLVCLPILCEHCPLESLLCLGSDGGVFKIIRIVFDSVVERFARESSSQVTNDHSKILLPDDIEEFRLRLASAASIVFHGVDRQPLLNESDVGFVVAANDEMTLSIASIVLSLLVSILELGRQQRTKKEEDTLQSFAVPLRLLSEMTASNKATDEIAMILGRISEVASYAAALVASRAAQTNGRVVDQPSHPNSTGDPLVLAESDLSSTEPPLRARSMVHLRKLVHSLDQSRNRISACVDDETPTERDEERIEMLRKILTLSFRALTDNESYVYLAAIHTVVAVVESEPNIFASVVGFAVASGRTTSELSCEELSSEQRIKLAESLTFLIRRRGSFDHVFFFLFETLASGPKPDKTEGSEYDSSFIQAATHDYFIDESGSPSNFEPESKSSDDYWEGIELRVRTGGPLFKVEEIDVVRAATITLVSELVSVVRTDVVARRCSVLIDCCVYTLRLESSRSIRRAGATLARELYAALVRELDDLYKSVHEQKNSSIPLSVAMLDGREDILHPVLEWVVSANDIKDSGQEERRYDPATVARCQEAINLRLEAVSGGILSAGTIVRQSNSMENQGLARLLKRSIGTNQPPRIVRIEELI